MQYLTPYFKEEYLFFTKLSEILNKLLTKEQFNDEEQYIVSLERPFTTIIPSLGSSLTKVKRAC